MAESSPNLPPMPTHPSGKKPVWKVPDPTDLDWATPMGKWCGRGPSASWLNVNDQDQYDNFRWCIPAPQPEQPGVLETLDKIAEASGNAWDGKDVDAELGREPTVDLAEPPRMTLRQYYAGLMLASMVNSIVFPQECEDQLHKAGIKTEDFDAWGASVAVDFADALIAALDAKGVGNE